MERRCRRVNIPRSPVLLCCVHIDKLWWVRPLIRYWTRIRTRVHYICNERPLPRPQWRKSTTLVLVDRRTLRHQKCLVGPVLCEVQWLLPIPIKRQLGWVGWLITAIRKISSFIYRTNLGFTKSQIANPNTVTTQYIVLFSHRTVQVPSVALSQ